METDRVATLRQLTLLVGAWTYAPKANPAATALLMWWLPFAAISIYWTVGGMWLVDTAVQAEGVELARQRPAWLVIVVLVSALMKLGFMVFAYLLVAPVGRRIPRSLYLLFGWGAGTAALAYGLMYTLMGLRQTWGQSITSKGWWHLFVWWPQFWVAGVLTIAATITFQRATRQHPRTP